jgi:hypothetical protein
MKQSNITVMLSPSLYALNSSSSYRGVLAWHILQFILNNNLVAAECRGADKGCASCYVRTVQAPEPDAEMRSTGAYTQSPQRSFL